MRITYVTQTRFPTEKAHGLQVAQVCDALASLGHEVTLVAPTIRNAVREKAHAYYGLPESFRVQHLRQFDALASWFIPGKLAFAVSMHFYRKALKKYLASARPELLYARSPAVLGPLLDSHIPVILELHTLPTLQKKEFISLCKKCARVICLTTPMRDELVSWGLSGKKVIVEGDGVNPEKFRDLPDPLAAAKKWKLPHGRIILGYVGSLVTHDTIEKGAAEIIRATAELKKRGDQPVSAWIVGGPKEWQKKYKELAKSLDLTEDDVRFHDPIPSASVPSALAAIDVCIYPAPASDHPFFQRDTSPLKLLEYLAAGRPTVCADLPPVRDLVDEESVWFCEPGNPVSLADAVLETFEVPADTMRRTEEGRFVAGRHSWTKRMERILKAVGKPL